MLNKKYFFVTLSAVGIHLTLGINSSYAVPCEDKIDTDFNYNGTYDAPVGKVWEYLWGNTHAKYTSVEDAKNKLFDTAVRYIDNRYEGIRQDCVRDIKYETSGGIELIACMNQVLANNGCDPSVFKKNGASPQRNSSSNRSSSSGPSSQANKKANQQATNSQSNQSNSGQFSKMSTEQLTNLSTSAEERGDYAQAYAAELELTKNPDPEISRQAMRRVGFRLGAGQGVTLKI